MATFITQGNYTQQAIKGMVDNPEDRQSAVAGLRVDRWCSQPENCPGLDHPGI